MASIKQPHMGQRFEQLLADRHVSKAEFGVHCQRSRQWVHTLCVSKNWTTSTVLYIARQLKLHPCDLFPRLLGLTPPPPPQP